VPSQTNGCKLHLLAVEPMVNAPLVTVGKTNVKLPVAFWQILKITCCPVTPPVKVLLVTLPVSVMKNVVATAELAVKVGVAEKLVVTIVGRSVLATIPESDSAFPVVPLNVAKSPLVEAAGPDTSGTNVPLLLETFAPWSVESP
jgi:hypothetical protein